MTSIFVLYLYVVLQRFWESFIFLHLKFLNNRRSLLGGVYMIVHLGLKHHVVAAAFDSFDESFMSLKVLLKGYNTLCVFATCVVTWDTFLNTLSDFCCVILISLVKCLCFAKNLRQNKGR